jgi:hypothetical protein
MKKDITTVEEYVAGLTEWEAWLFHNSPLEQRKFTGYDHLCELAVSAYDLDTSNRKVEIKDRLHYFLLWWKRNRKYMKKYNSLTAIGGLVKKDHSNVMHYVGKENEKEGLRKKSAFFEENVECIKDFLES